MQLLLAHRVREQRLDPELGRSSGTAPDSSRERSRSCVTSRPSRSTWASIVRSVSGSGSPTPSTRFSSGACSAVIGVRSSWRHVGDEVAAHPVGLGELGRHLVERRAPARRPRRAVARDTRGSSRPAPSGVGGRPSRAAATSCPARNHTMSQGDRHREDAAHRRPDPDLMPTQKTKTVTPTGTTMTKPSFSLIDGTRRADVRGARGSRIGHGPPRRARRPRSRRRARCG